MARKRFWSKCRFVTCDDAATCWRYLTCHATCWTMCLRGCCALCSKISSNIVKKKKEMTSKLRSRLCIKLYIVVHYLNTYFIASGEVTGSDWCSVDSFQSFIFVPLLFFLKTKTKMNVCVSYLSLGLTASTDIHYNSAKMLNVLFLVFKY